MNTIPIKEMLLKLLNNEADPGKIQANSSDPYNEKEHGRKYLLCPTAKLVLAEVKASEEEILKITDLLDSNEVEYGTEQYSDLVTNLTLAEQKNLILSKLVEIQLLETILASTAEASEKEMFCSPDHDIHYVFFRDNTFSALLSLADTATRPDQQDQDIEKVPRVLH